jgi:hypothetical protein
MTTSTSRRALRQLALQAFHRNAQLNEARYVSGLRCTAEVVGIDGPDVAVSTVSAPLALPFVHDSLQTPSSAPEVVLTLDLSAGPRRGHTPLAVRRISPPPSVVSLVLFPLLRQLALLGLSLAADHGQTAEASCLPVEGGGWVLLFAPRAPDRSLGRNLCGRRSLTPFRRSGLVEQVILHSLDPASGRFIPTGPHRQRRAPASKRRRGPSCQSSDQLQPLVLPQPSHT